MSRVYMDSFSGALSDLPKAKRDFFNALAVLKNAPRVSVFDMAEHAWLRGLVSDLAAHGLIVEDNKEPYPWHRYMLTEAGKSMITTLENVNG